MYRGWRKIDYQGKHCITDQTDKETWDDQGRDRRTNFTWRIKEQATRLTPLFENDGDDDISNFLSDLCAIRYEETVDFLVSAVFYIIVPNKGLKLMSSTQCQLPLFFVCCPADIFYTKLQTNNSKLSA